MDSYDNDFLFLDDDLFWYTSDRDLIFEYEEGEENGVEILQSEPRGGA